MPDNDLVWKQAPSVHKYSMCPNLLLLSQFAQNCTFRARLFVSVLFTCMQNFKHVAQVHSEIRKCSKMSILHAMWHLKTSCWRFSALLVHSLYSHACGTRQPNYKFRTHHQQSLEHRSAAWQTWNGITGSTNYTVLVVTRKKKKTYDSVVHSPLLDLQISQVIPTYVHILSGTVKRYDMFEQECYALDTKMADCTAEDTDTYTASDRNTLFGPHANCLQNIQKKERLSAE